MGIKKDIKNTSSNTVSTTDATESEKTRAHLRAQNADAFARQEKSIKTALPHGSMLIFAIVVAVLLYSNGITRILAHGLRVFAHEFGHTVTAWLLGYPAMPVFSSVGASTVNMGRPLLLMFALLVLYVYFFYRWLKQAKRINFAWLLCWVVFFIIFISPTLSNAVITFMGAGGEIAGGFLFCFVAWSLHRKVFIAYRYILFAIGFLLHVGVYSFAYMICFSPRYMDVYLNPANEQTNDLVRIHDALGISIKGSAVILVFMATASLFLLWKTRNSPHDFLMHMRDYFKSLFRSYFKKMNENA